MKSSGFPHHPGAASAVLLLILSCLFPGTPAQVRILIGGDTLIGGYYNSQQFGTMDELSKIMDQRYRECGAECCAAYFQSDFTELIAASDFTWVNLEGPITPPVDISIMDSLFTDKEIPLRAFEHSAEILDELGIDLVSLANNHTHDYLGKTGLEFTVESLSDRVPTVGAGVGLASYNPKIVRIHGISFAFSAITDVVDPASLGFGLDELITAVIPDTTRYLENARFRIFLEKFRAARDRTDFSLVYIHFGPVRGQTVTPRQEELAQILLDEQADIIVGTSSHAAQPVREIKDNDGNIQQLVFYGLGNFIFGGRRSRQEKGMLAELHFAMDNGRKTIHYDVRYIDPNPDASFIPRLLD